MSVQGLDRLKRKLKALPERARRPIRSALEQSATEITAMQRNLVPVDDGVLRGTIRSASDPELLRVTIEAGGEATTKPVRNGADAEYDYALGVEFGTKEMAARPFFLPAYRALRKRAKSRASRAIRQAAKDVASS